MRAYTADMIPGGASPVINVSQYDNDYAVTVTLIEGAEIYTPPSGATIMVEGTKPDGNGFSYACTYQGNVVTVPIYTQMTAVAGRFPIELVVYQSGLRVGSCNITLAVERAPLDSDEIISDSDIPAIIALAQAQADAAAASATAAASSAASAETAKDAAMDAAQDAIDAAQELQTAIQFNAALIHETASGAVASFSDGADDIPMQSVVAEITPVQSGSGDPSPDNIRPISGRTGMTVTRSGKNLAIPGYDKETVIAGLTITPTEKGIRVRGTATARKAIDLFTVADNYRHIPLAYGTKITVSLYKNGDISAAENPFIGYYANGAYGGNVGTLSADNNYTLSWTVTAKYADAYDSYLRSYVYIPSGATVDFEIGLQIEIGTSATGYEPYAGHTYPITWESIAGTVYGGTLDVVSGVLTVDKYFLTCADTITPNVGAYAYATNPNRWQIPLSGDYTPSGDKMGESISDTFRYYDGGLSVMPENTFRFSGIQSGGYRLLQFKLADQPTTVEDLTVFLAENPIHFVIPFATPQTYQLTPTEVRTILGGNNIYTDAGDVSVEYIADTKLYIDNKIAELQALVLEN